MTYIPIPYPRRLYLNGEVIEGDLHATNSVVVESADAEAEARKKGYRKAWEKVIEKTTDGSNGGSSRESLSSPFNSPASVTPPNQDSVAAVSADPIADDVDDIEALRKQAESLGIKVDKRWKEARLKAEIEGAQ